MFRLVNVPCRLPVCFRLRQHGQFRPQPCVPVASARWRLAAGSASPSDTAGFAAAAGLAVSQRSAQHHALHKSGKGSAAAGSLSS